MQYDPLEALLFFLTCEYLKWTLFGVRHRESGVHTKKIQMKLKHARDIRLDSMELKGFMDVRLSD